MRITIATGLYPPEIGGPATYAKMLEEDLPAHDIAVDVIPFSSVKAYPKVIKHLVYTKKVWVSAKHADLIYALDPVSVGLPALLVAKIKRLPFLVRLGGDYAWEQAKGRFGVSDLLDDFHAKRSTWPFQVSILHRLQTYVVSQAKQIIVPSQYLKSVVEKWGIESNQIKVIYSALSPLPASSNTTNEFKAGPVISSAGRLVPWKGFGLLLEIVSELKSQYPDIKLVIIGDGINKIELSNKAKELGVTEQVIFKGDVSKNALRLILDQSDVFVLNTAYEGLSHQLMEVMEVGVPIVTTNAGGNTELIEDGKSGLLFDFNDREGCKASILNIIEHPESARDLVQEGKIKVTSFSRERLVKEIVEVLNHYGSTQK